MKWPFQGREGADWADRSRAMVDEQLRSRGVKDPVVLGAMERVPRHCFVPAEMHYLAYSDGPLPIGHGQTISQPYIVAVMTEALQPRPGMKVLEIGTGSGYQAAVLAEAGLEVYSVECVAELAGRARAQLEELGYRNVHYRVGDGKEGWPEAAPFDGILVTAAPEELPENLASQLAVGGRLVIPVGRPDRQYLRVYRKNEDGTLEEDSLFAVRFVPLV